MWAYRHHPETKNFIEQRSFKQKLLKDKSFVICQKGKNGPKWLHRLIYRAALNCGMVVNNIVSQNKMVIEKKFLSPKFAIDTFRKNLDAFNAQGFDEKDLVCYVGQEDWTGYIRESHLITSNIKNYGYTGDKLLGVSVVAVPHLRGMFFVPKRLTIHPNF